MPYKDHFILANRIKIHLIEYNTRKNLRPLIMLHGLTANAHCFDGMVYNGLAEKFHLYIPDLRGRGHSDKPAFNYGMRHHAKDIIAMMDHFGLEKVSIAGHSFGGLLAVYLATHYPERVEQIIVIDAAAEMNPKVGQMLLPVLKRLDSIYPSFQAYLDYIKASPSIRFWDDVMETYYRADVKTLPGGKVRTYASLANMIKVSIGVSNQNWKKLFAEVSQPLLLINATGIYNNNEALLPEHKARETFELLQHGVYKKVSGNHQTMLYGEGAKEMVAAIKEFMQPAQSRSLQVETLYV